jgi:hypothetical protein
MPLDISVKGSDPNQGSRAFHWPVLEAGNNSYQNGVYSVTWEEEERGKSFTLRHEVQGAKLIEQWMKAGKLIFICSVASPRSMYRGIHTSTTAHQLVKWEQDDLGEPPMFTPMLIAGEEIHHTVDCKSDELNPIWAGREIHLDMGARVAVGKTFRLQSGLNGILEFNLDEELGPGQVKVEASSENGFTFKVHLAPGLYNHLKYRRKEMPGINIMIHVISTALGILQREYAEAGDEEGTGWQSYRNLVGLAELLQQHGVELWSDEDFKPELAATKLYPHPIPSDG